MDIHTNFNTYNVTPLCELMAMHGSDKSAICNLHHGHHNYSTFYYELFKNVRNSELRIFELGIGSKNPTGKSNMGLDGKPGASLRAWCDFFPAARVYGADIDRDCLFSEDRIMTFYCDQCDRKSINELWEMQELQMGFDVIIEDGYHNFHANKLFFEASAHKLNVGGVYIMEDLILTDLVHYIRQVHEWEAKYPNFTFRLLPVPHTTNFYDNILLIVQRNSL